LLFWDTSAIVPLLVREHKSDDVRRILQEDGNIIASWITPVEVSSSLWRRRHHNHLSLEEHQRAETRFAQLSTRWLEVAQSAVAIEVALDLLARHRLRALDAIQLGTLISIREALSKLPFITLDEKLAAAARAEGFPVLP